MTNSWDLLKYFDSSSELKLIARLLKIKQEYNIDIPQPALEGDEVAWYKKAKMKSLYFYYDDVAQNNFVMASMQDTKTDEIINPTDEQIANQMKWIIE